MCCSIMINITVELQLDGLFLPARQLLTTDAIFLYQLVHPGVHVEPICILQGHEAVREEDRWVLFWHTFICSKKDFTLLAPRKNSWQIRVRFKFIKFLFSGFPASTDQPLFVSNKVSSSGSPVVVRSTARIFTRSSFLPCMNSLVPICRKSQIFLFSCRWHPAIL